MKQGMRLQKRTIRTGAALLCGLGLSAWTGGGLMAFANTTTMTLSVSTLPFGYNAPYAEQVTGFGTHFVQGGTVVYVLQNGSDVHQASNFQVTDNTHLSFSVGSGLQPGQTYTVEVETPVGGQLETETTSLSVAPAASVAGFTDNGQPGATYLGVGYTAATVNITVSNGNLASQTAVLIQDSSGNNVNTAAISGVQVTGASGGSQTVGFILGSGLVAGSYKFVMRTNGQDLDVPFTVRNPQVQSISPANPIAGQGQTLTFTTTGANLSSGNDTVKIGNKAFSNVTVTGNNQIAVAISANDAALGTQQVTISDASESFGGSVTFVAATTPTIALSMNSVSDGYGTTNVTVTPTNFSLGNSPTATLQPSGGGTASTVTLTQSRGVWSFSVPAGLAIGTYTLTVTGINNTQASTSFAVADVAPSVVKPSTVFDAVVGQAYPAVTLATNGSGSYTWSVAQGSLPAGLTLSSQGILSGTPLATDSTSTPYTFTVQASGTYGAVSQQYTLSLDAAPSITSSTNLGSVTQGDSFDTTFAANGTGMLTWKDPDGKLPAGLTLESNGQLHGTVTAGAKTYAFIVQVSNSVGQDSRQFTLTVNAAAPTGNQGGSGNGGTPTGSQGGSSNGGTPTGSQGGSGNGGTPTGNQGGSSNGGTPTGNQGGSGNGNGNGGTPTGNQGGSGNGDTPTGSQGGSGNGGTPTGNQGGSGNGGTSTTKGGGSGNDGTSTGNQGGNGHTNGVGGSTGGVSGSGHGSKTQTSPHTPAREIHWPKNVGGVSHTLLTQSVSSAPTTLKKKAYGNLISVAVPRGAFRSKEQVRLVAATPLQVRKLKPKNATALTAIGINFGGKAPSKPISVTIRNHKIEANEVVYVIRGDNKFTRIKAKVGKGRVVVSVKRNEDILIATPSTGKVKKTKK